MKTSSQRIEKLRQHALDVKETLQWLPPRIDLWAQRAWIASSGEPWSIVRHARETEAILNNLKPVIDPDELIVGKFDLTPLSIPEAEELNFYHQKIQPAKPLILGMKAHMAIDFDRLLHRGISGTQGRD